MSFNKDASWIRKTLRTKSMKDYKELRSQSKTLTRAREANRKATLVSKREQMTKRREGSKIREMDVDPSVMRSSIDENGAVVSTTDKGEVEATEEDQAYDEYSSEYEYETESEEEEEDPEANEMNFNKLLELRVQTTDFQLDAFCAKYIFVLKKEGVKKVHNLADEFENLCREIYEPMLASATPKRKGTLRKLTVSKISMTEAAPELKIPSELPTQHAKVQAFFTANDIGFDTEEAQEKLYAGMHVGDSCCFLQFLVLKYRDMILDQYLQRWTKTKEELGKKNIGALLLEEYFMPPMNVEPKLDAELVKFSNLMANRQFEIKQFHHKMQQKNPNGVAYNILKTELNKYVKELEEKINVSEIYFAAAIMRVKQKQQAELDRIYDVIEEEDRVDNMGPVEGFDEEEETDTGDELSVTEEDEEVEN